MTLDSRSEMIGDLKKVTTYSFDEDDEESYVLFSVEYQKDGVLHREDGPALIEYFDNGVISLQKFYLNGVIHREDGPAEVEYFDSGNVSRKVYWLNGNRHREDGPAEIFFHVGLNEVVSSENYYHNGLKHRDEDGPARIKYRENSSVESENFYKDGMRHRDGDKPASICYRDDGTINSERFYQEDVEHREGGPSYTYFDKFGAFFVQSYKVSGKFHRGGDYPSIIMKNPYGNDFNISLSLNRGKLTGLNRDFGERRIYRVGEIKDELTNRKKKTI